MARDGHARAGAAKEFHIVRTAKGLRKKRVVMGMCLRREGRVRHTAIIIEKYSDMIKGVGINEKS